MGKKQSINLGFRGWMLLIYQFIAFFSFIILTNWPMNIIPHVYGGSQVVSTLYTTGTLLCILFQLIFSRFIGRIKNIKAIGSVFGIVALLFGLGIMIIPQTQVLLLQICYFFLVFTVITYCTLFVGILVGQWFPRRKGTIMGIATFAFPIGNGLLGTFASRIFEQGLSIFMAFLPFYIICIVGVFIGIIFIKDYPEQCNACRDNDRSLSPEQAKAMLAQEIEAKKTSVWTLKHTMSTKDFWFITIPMGALLLCAVGMMTQSMSIIGSYPELPFGTIMFVVMLVACAGSWLLGVLDTKFGTKKAVLISVIIMIISGIFGAIPSSTTLVVALLCLSLFMGASSNFTVSSAAQYWRREDFSKVFSYINPVANILQALGPMSFAFILATQDYTLAFIVTGVVGIISLILIIAFSGKHVKAADDKYRAEAGKVLDDALVGRK